jgi:large subunit ribosomal protein L6
METNGSIGNGINIEIVLPEKTTVQFGGNVLTVKGPKGEASKLFSSKIVNVSCSDGKIILRSLKKRKDHKKQIKSYAAHVRNLIRGSTEGHKYLLKICSGHFPMNVSINNGQLIVKNFLGEKIPRIVKLRVGADVKIEGDQIVVEGTNKEIAGQVSADIEQLTRRTGYDARIFQDGIWITMKDGKEIS